MKYISPLPKVFAIGVLVLLTARSLLVADLSWDTLAYHLPFAAMRAGLISNENFIFPPHVAAAYSGFPSAIYYLKGFLWLITDSPQTTQIVNVISIVVFAAFAKKVLDTPMEWVVIGVLAIPLIQIGASVNMTDVPANMGMSMLILSLYKLATRPSEIPNSDLVWLLVACGLASGSKPQAVVVGTIIFSAYIVLFYFLRRKSATVKNSDLILLGLCGLIVLYPAIINTYRHSNPIYPMELNIAGLHFPGLFNSGNWRDPEYLNALPQQIRWLLSVLEFHAYDFRSVPYTVDQGDVPTGAKSFRMGGYFAPLIAMSFFIIAFLTLRRLGRGSVNGILVLTFVTALIASLPGAHELRYYSCWAVSVVVIAIENIHSPKNDASLVGFAAAYKAFLVISFLFVGMITGFRYLDPRGISYSEAALVYRVEREVVELNGSTNYCYGADWRGAIFDSAAFGKTTSKISILDKSGVCRKN